MIKNTPVTIEEEQGPTTALLIGDDLPLIKSVLSRVLQQQGCTIALAPKRGAHFDYVLVFGSHTKETVVTDHLKDDGKALYIVPDDEVNPGITKNFQIFRLKPEEPLPSAVLADQILHVLFHTKHYHTSDDVQPHDLQTKEQQKPDIQPKRTFSVLQSLRIVVLQLLLILVLLLTPPLVTAGALGVSGYYLQSVIDMKLPREIRREHLGVAKQSFTIGKRTSSMIIPTIAFINPQLANIASACINLFENILLTANHALILEEHLTARGAQLTKSTSKELAIQLPLLTQSLSDLELTLTSAELTLGQLAPIKSYIPENLWKKSEMLPKLRKSIQQGRELITIVPTLLAFEEEKRYLLLLQNNFELRATGGFIGSYGVMTVTDGRITDISIEDVYEADGQLKGNVEPPLPIAKYLGQPNWFLRDSNWNPDFALSAEQAEWFLKKELKQTYDGVIAVDLYVLKALLVALGGVYVSDYQATVTADDFFYKLQSDTHEQFFPGSNKKRDLLSSLATSLLIDIGERENLPAIELGRAVQTTLNEKHLLVYLHDAEAQSVIEQLGWGGKVIKTAQDVNEQTIEDYVMLVDSNLGVNKSNYYISRDIITSLALSQNNITRHVSILYRNTGPQKDTLFGGKYKNYLRFLIPTVAHVESISIDSSPVSLADHVDNAIQEEKQVVGILIEVPEQQERTIVLTYTIPIPDIQQIQYRLLLQKQPGTDADPFVLKLKESSPWRMSSSNLPSNPFLSDLRVDRLITIDFMRSVE